MYHILQGMGRSAGATAGRLGQGVALNLSSRELEAHELLVEGELQADDLLVYSNGCGFNLGSVIA